VRVTLGMVVVVMVLNKILEVTRGCKPPFYDG
jgi:hypothetical protein